MGEAFSLVEKLGANPKQFHDVLVNGLFGAPAYEVYGKLITNEAWESGGATAVTGLKDAALAIEAAETAEMPLPVPSFGEIIWSAPSSEAKAIWIGPSWPKNRREPPAYKTDLPIIDQGFGEFTSVHMWHSGASNNESSR